MITRKKIKIATQDSIAHWERMIAWVKTRPPKEFVSIDAITRELSENWYGNHCAVCKLFSDGKISDNSEGGCYSVYNGTEYNCPMIMPGRPGCNSVVSCDHSPHSWQRLLNTHTWEQWLFHAKKILKHLKGVKI